jgi:hypothetical protein
VIDETVFAGTVKVTSLITAPPIVLEALTLNVAIPKFALPPTTTCATGDRPVLNVTPAAAIDATPAEIVGPVTDEVSVVRFEVAPRYVTTIDVVAVRPDADEPKSAYTSRTFVDPTPTARVDEKLFAPAIGLPITLPRTVEPSLTHCTAKSNCNV